MRTWTAERLGAVAGIGFIVLNVIGNLLAGSPPGTDDSPAKIASFFQDHHRSVAASVILTGAASALFIWLIAALALRLRALGQLGWAGVAFALGVGAAVLGTVSDALYGSLARIGLEGDDRLTQGIYQLGGFVAVKTFWLGAGAILVVGIAAWRTLPRWYAAVSFAAAVVAALGGLTVKQSGFLSPLGGLAWIAFIAVLVWALATCVVIWTAAEAEEVEVRRVPAVG